ncbi:anhydro-N-acetylmuramic acid kinase [Ancylobacter sp. 6x-1]|uniref:Anhydro-N-acetylmuramic acid kinase n=1 Tax=Ancylobacter crimeensis TaxID=2579147 RepID=A0ABT0D6C2_9HYPH|nr:anhydro-N-acetylmuramic acid kinase [Ancylobacter crimeensis]MCK0195484.1 anhydro-N-acetylmuramic acid kinase [Ancylobacter crimeensis]
MTAVGLMSGTSLDGIDVALIETDGERVAAFGPSRSYPYSDADRALFFRALKDARTVQRRKERPGCLGEAEARITGRHADALLDFLGMVQRPVDMVGFHGQTVLHRPEQHLTVQIGDGAGLFAAMQRSPFAPRALVYDLRAADVAAGGQGAPLVPVYHRALLAGVARPQPVLVLNLGGVANITFIDGAGEPAACDTGPANALIDDFVMSRTGAAYDAGGRMAAAGRVDEVVLALLMAHPFFRLPLPKSLDRNDFRDWVTQRGGLDAMTTEDGAATLTALTAACVAAVLPLLPRHPQGLIVAGGGAHNATLLRMIGERTGLAVERADALGWDGDALEAQAFAFLALRRARGLPISFPGTTGAPKPLTGGILIGSLP